MRGRIAIMLLSGISLWGSLYAQTTANPGSPADAEREGKRVLQQRCSICHTPPLTGDKTYGPALSAASVAKEAAAREIILKGTPRMPGFQYGLQPEQIDAIIAYLKTVKIR